MSIDNESDPAALHRAIELANRTKEEVAKEHLTDHAVIETSKQLGTTVGISYEEHNATISGYGGRTGQAFNSKKIWKGDTILAIDGQKIKGADILGLLKGVDKPGSIVELTLERTSVSTSHESG